LHHNRLDAEAQGKKQEIVSFRGLRAKSAERMHGPAISGMIQVIRHPNPARNDVFAPT